MQARGYILVLAVALSGCLSQPSIRINKPVFHTLVTTRNVTRSNDSFRREGSTERALYRGNYIDVQVMNRPHNLFIGRCAPDHRVLHGENVILNNDGRSHVTAVIQFNVEGPIYIACVKVLDQNPELGAYPSYSRGGVGYNFVEIDVSTMYGKGFNFFVQILGYLDKKDVPKKIIVPARKNTIP